MNGNNEAERAVIRVIDISCGGARQLAADNALSLKFIGKQTTYGADDLEY